MDLFFLFYIFDISSFAFIILMLILTFYLQYTFVLFFILIFSCRYFYEYIKIDVYFCTKYINENENSIIKIMDLDVLNISNAKYCSILFNIIIIFVIDWNTTMFSIEAYDANVIASVVYTKVATQALLVLWFWWKPTTQTSLCLWFIQRSRRKRRRVYGAKNQYFCFLRQCKVKNYQRCICLHLYKFFNFQSCD